MSPVASAAGARTWSAPTGHHCIMSSGRLRRPGSVLVDAHGGPPLHECTIGTRLAGPIMPPPHHSPRRLSRHLGTQ
eukprot:jgi/Tetstr1/465963/TSEL_010555.t1